MLRKATSKYSVVGSGALYDLAAELEAQKEKLHQQAGSSSSIKGLKREPKKSSRWLAPSKGLASRVKRQEAHEEANRRLGKVDKATLETSQAALERKARIYDELKRGGTGGLSERQLKEAAVDWDKKIDEEGYSSDSSFEHSDEAGPSGSGRRAEDDDPETEYEDNLGRTRTVRRSQVPAYALEAKRRAKMRAEPAPENLIYGDHQYYPVYEPSPEDLRARWKAAEGEPIEKHYDGAAEVRNRSAAFYQFSNDADERARQQAELAAARAETEAARRDVDVPEPGAALSADKGKGRADHSLAAPLPPAPPKQFGGKASEKRKRELDERRAMLEERKRRKEVDGLLKQVEGELAQESASKPPSAG